MTMMTTLQLYNIHNVSHVSHLHTILNHLASCRIIRYTCYMGMYIYMINVNFAQTLVRHRLWIDLHVIDTRLRVIINVLSRGELYFWRNQVMHTHTNQHSCTNIYPLLNSRISYPISFSPFWRGVSPTTLSRWKLLILCLNWDQIFANNDVSTFISFTFVLINPLIKHINPYSAGIDFRRQNLTSVDVRFWRLKSIPALYELSYL